MPKSAKPAQRSAAASQTTADIYADPLVYDILHAEDTGRDCRVIEKLVRGYVPGAAAGPLRLLEPASGSGRYQIGLAKRGHHTTGVDLDCGMLAFAQQRAEAFGVSGLVAQIRADMRSFAPPKPRCHAAFNFINSIRHLLSDSAMTKHMDAIERSLVPGGVYIVGIELIDRAIAEPTEDVWTGKRGGAHVQQLISYLPASMHGGPSRRERVISSVTVTKKSVGGATGSDSVRQIDSAYWLRTYTPTEWTGLLRRCGWHVIGEHTSSGAALGLRPHGYRLCVLRPEG